METSEDGAESLILKYAGIFRITNLRVLLEPAKMSRWRKSPDFAHTDRRFSKIFTRVPEKHGGFGGFMQIRNRIKEMRLIPANQVRPNPKNWRTHPKNQQDALRGVLSEVGIADAVIARELEDGSLMLIDGHLRTETLGNEMIPVLVLDVNEEEADKLLATMDPLAELARADESKLGALLQTITTESEALEAMLSSMVDFDDLGLDVTGEEEAEDDVNPNDEPDEPPPSGVRMVQLFLNEQTIVLFQERIDQLSRAYGLDNITDTVFEAVYRESLSLQNKV